ncbi:MAG: methyltransferase domain-containing protein [Alphaproteobacteria bacterium]|nr:methyltransferase domain-containing protein [Alphaproteobacteria bacterium]
MANSDSGSGNAQPPSTNGNPPRALRPRATPRPGVPRTLGPVSDLERHLPHDWWRTLFNAVYLQTDGDVVEDNRNTSREMDEILRFAGLDPGDRILDLCCGQGRHAIELARRGFTHVTGMDRSRYLVRLARRRARRENLDIVFKEGDARQVRLPEASFDAVLILGNSFGYFERPEDDAEVLSAIRRISRSGATLVLDLTDGDWVKTHFEPRSWEWIDRDHFVNRERALSADGTRLVCREVVTNAEKGVIADQFYAERLYNPESITKLLEGAGFHEVRIHHGVETESERNQDLGMMSRRFFVTAVAPARAPRSARGPIYPNVTVLMGDPRLPDPVKLGGRFNAEDMATIVKLKEALNQLPGYKWEYLDNHATLIQDLRNKRPEFVLNLCDEGFNNDAFKELHVPAILELLDIPYTGAAPSCLGLCYDKSLVRAVAEELGIPVPLETYTSPDDTAATIPSVFPALLKPATGDSSIGITQKSVVRNFEEAVSYLNYLRETFRGRPILVQEYLTGPEYSVGLVGNPGDGFNVFPVLEVDYSSLPKDLPPILSYESKWDPESPYWTDIRYRPSRADEDVQRRMIDASIKLFERLGCRDYARVDFRADANGTVKLLEMNPNPGWCWDGKFNLMAGFAGHSYGDLLGMIVEAAQVRVAAARAKSRQAAAAQ